MSEAQGQAVLEAIDKVLADRPHKIGHDFSEVTRRLTAWREEFIAQWRQSQGEGDRRNLERVNAAISVVIGCQFPLDKVRWQEIEDVRKDLGELAGGKQDRAVRSRGKGAPVKRAPSTAKREAIDGTARSEAPQQPRS